MDQWMDGVSQCCYRLLVPLHFINITPTFSDINHIICCIKLLFIICSEVISHYELELHTCWEWWAKQCSTLSVQTCSWSLITSVKSNSKERTKTMFLLLLFQVANFVSFLVLKAERIFLSDLLFLQFFLNINKVFWTEKKKPWHPKAQ